MLILVTNDDGVHSSGLDMLAGALSALGRVVIVAPDRERSAIGHALTLHSPLRAELLKPDIFAVDGTPTDCVNLGIHGLLDARPDLVVSGINRGANMGEDVTYSGTVSAALEATLMGVPAFAISLDLLSGDPSAHAAAARFAQELATTIVRHGLPEDTFLNVNVPAGTPRGVRITRQGKRRYQDMIVEKIDPRGRKYYWIGGGQCQFESIPGSDFVALAEGFTSVTPLHLDLTNYHSFDTLQLWQSASQEAFFLTDNE
ncbi:MAG: 5'/3'-nucleotidase SurE [Syntrophotaleaceae bacterium]